MCCWRYSHNWTKNWYGTAQKSIQIYPAKLLKRNENETMILICQKDVRYHFRLLHRAQARQTGYQIHIFLPHCRFEFQYKTKKRKVLVKGNMSDDERRTKEKKGNFFFVYLDRKIKRNFLVLRCALVLIRMSLLLFRKSSRRANDISIINLLQTQTAQIIHSAMLLFLAPKKNANFHIFIHFRRSISLEFSSVWMCDM